MKPVKPIDANMLYKRPPSRPDIGDLHCTRIKPGVIRTEWRLSRDELNYLLAGGNVELDIHGEPIPPVALNVTEPFCPECSLKMEMEWAESCVVPYGAGPLDEPDFDVREPHYHFRCPTCRRWA